MKQNTFALRGDILYSDAQKQLVVHKDSWLVCENGKVAGIFDALPGRYSGIPAHDHSGRLITPGFTDLHLHAPQYSFRGLGMDLELLDWLEQHTFPEEAKYIDLEYARKAYSLFVQALVRGGTTRASVFATVHLPATLLLMELLDSSGLVTYVGKVNQDRNSNPDLQEQSAEASLEATRHWLNEAQGRFSNTRPILTPRFVPSCSDPLLKGLGNIQRQTGLPVQSHLSENLAEIAWVKELCPKVETYADAYIHSGLFGGPGCPTIMAHCVHSLGQELAQLRHYGVWVAHCPISNHSLSSGVAPVRAFLQNGVRCGLGTDIAGGYDLSIFGVMAAAVNDSKLRWRLQDDSLAPLTPAEAFWLATRGGGSFFGRVGAFEPDYEFDALVLDDTNLPCPFSLTPAQRLERLIFLGGDTNVAEKYVAGKKIF